MTKASVAKGGAGSDDLISMINTERNIEQQIRMQIELKEGTLPPAQS